MKQKEEKVYHQQHFKNMTLQLANTGCKCPQTTILKLKIINLSSQNHTLKRKISELEQSLKINSQYKIAFDNVIKVTKQLIRKQGVSESRVSEQLNKIIRNSSLPKESTISTDINAVLTRQRNTQRINQSSPLTKTADKRFDKLTKERKSDQIQQSSRLTQNDQRDTVKSLDLSLDSRSAIDKEDKQSQTARKDIESMRQSLEAVYNLKTRLLLQQLEQLKTENEQLKNEMSEKCKDQWIQEEPTLKQWENERETAYFPVCFDHISQQQQEESLGQEEQSQNSYRNVNKSQPALSRQKLQELSHFIAPLKQTLQKLRYILTSQPSDLTFLLESLDPKVQKQQIKIIDLEEYLVLLQCQKQEKVYLSLYRGCQQENQRLKGILKQFI